MKKFVESVIKNRTNNYIITVVIVIVIWLILSLIMAKESFFLAKWLGTSFFSFILFIASASFIWSSSKKQVTSLSREEIMFLGKGTGIWLEEGFYFLWFGLFVGRPGEIQNLENRDVKLLNFECQDKNGKKLRVDVDGDYEIENADIFMKFKEVEMSENIKRLVERLVSKIIGQKEFYEDILGKDLGQEFLNDIPFKDICRGRYGIKFKALDPSIQSGNLTQDDLNQYRKKLVEQMKIEHPSFSPEEIEELVQIQLRNPAVKRINIKGKGGSIPFVST